MCHIGPCRHRRRSSQRQNAAATVWCNGVENRVIGNSLPVPVQWIRVARHYAHVKGCPKVWLAWACNLCPRVCMFTENHGPRGPQPLAP